MNRQFFFRFALALFLIMVSRASLAQEELFVTNTSAVTVYARTASGNTPPLRAISGSNTGLSGGGGGLAVDVVNNELFVVQRSSPSSVRVFDRMANGNVLPLRAFSSAGLTDPRGLFVDVVNDELAVVNRSTNSVLVFARTATGDVGPLRTITSLFPSTGLSNPTGVAIDVLNDELVVANNGGSLSVYARTANGNADPLRKISGSNTGFNNGPVGVAVDIVNDELVVTNPSFDLTFLPSVQVFARTTTGNVAPSRNITGAATGLVNPAGLAVDVLNNEVLVANQGAGSVTVYARTETGNVTPLRTLAGSNTQLNSPQFLAITIDTDALFANGFE